MAHHLCKRVCAGHVPVSKVADGSTSDETAAYPKYTSSAQYSTTSSYYVPPSR